MHKVYRYLVNDSSKAHEVHAFVDVFKVVRIAHVFRALRNEYLAFLLSKFAFKRDLKWLPRFVLTFGKLLYFIKASLTVFYDPSVSDSPVHLLPVLQLQAKWPALSLRCQLQLHLTPQFSWTFI
jgi:hypothetical protein